MKIGIVYSGVGGPNGADYVAEYMHADCTLAGMDTVLIGKHGGYDPATVDIPKVDLLVHSSAFNLTTDFSSRLRRIAPLVAYTHNDEIWRSLDGISHIVDLHACYSPRPFGHCPTLYTKVGKQMYCPIGASAAHYYPLDIPKVTDICLVGSRRAWRVEFCKRLCDAGYRCQFNWSMIRPFEEINRIYAQTKIVLAPVQDCDLDVPGAAAGCPCRTFDVRAAGAFQLETMRHGLHVYPMAVKIITPLDMDAAVKLWRAYIDHFLHSPNEREAIAKEDYEWTIKHHLYRHRVAAMVSALGLS
jgi:hypothetical protein